MLIETDNLNFTDLSKMVRGEVYAVLVKGFIDRDPATQLSDEILEKGADSYINAPSVVV